jgi:voltage-dependent calcium channel L type alpha-1D
MTPAQKEWALTQSFVMKIKPERRFSRPKGKLRGSCYDFVMPHVNPWFDRFIICVIILNTVCIATATFGDSAVKSRQLELFNDICSFIFVVEAALRIISHGRAYFCSKWNRFDFSIVLGLIIGFVLKLTIADRGLVGSISSIISLMRIGRLVRLIRLVKSLRTIANSLVTATPGILNVGGLLILLFYIYSIIGMQLYGTVAYLGELNEHANFRTLGNSMLLLFRFSTGENWNGYMWDMLKDRPQCDPNPTYNKNAPWCLRDEDYPNCTEVNGCSAGLSVFVYFYSFILIVGLVVLNMVVGVVLEAFENSQESDLLSPSDLDHFVGVWAEFDPNATNYIKASEVNVFLRKLKPPLGLGADEATKSDNFNQDDLYFKDQSLLEIPVNENKQVNIVNVARQVAKRLVKAVSSLFVM